MEDVALLELAKKIVVSHQRVDATGPALVVPVVHDTIDPDHLALSAIAERYGGKYIRCDDYAYRLYEAPAPINEMMARHLTELCASRNLFIDIVEQHGHVVAVSRDPGTATGALPMILRVIAGLSSSDLNNPLVVMSYSLSGLDEVRAALLWEAMLAPQQFAPSVLRTFVPVAAGDVDVPRHCNRREGSVRLVVRDGELIERGPAVLLSDSLPMMQANTDEPIVLFLGAGASASSNMPQGNYLRDQALASLLQRPVGSPELIASFRRWLTDHERWMSDEESLPVDMFERNLTLERVLREEFYCLGGKPRSRSATVQRMIEDCALALDRLPEGRKALWKLAATLPRLLIATVNFDQLIETGMEAEHRVVVGRDDFASCRDLIIGRIKGNDGAVPILKLHGSIDNPDTLVADITTTGRGLPAEVVATLDAMIEASHGYLTWIWIGCSMRDADIGMWLANKDGVKDLQEWWVDPLPPRSVYSYAEKIRSLDWAPVGVSLRARQVTETSDRFLSAFEEYAVGLGKSTG